METSGFRTWDVQLRFYLGAASASGSSVASGTQGDGCGIAVLERGVRCVVCRLGWLPNAPEYILRALLLQVFYLGAIRTRLLVEQIDYNLLFRWFVGLGMDDAVWIHAVFSKNRDRLLSSDVAQQFFAEVNKQAGAVHERRAL